MQIALLEPAFSALAEQPSTAADIAFGYRIFLGREPENEAVVEDAMGSPASAFIGALMVSDEFRHGVVDGLAGEARLPHEDGGPGPSPEQMDWLFERLAVPARSEQVLRAAVGWREWFRLLVAMPGFPM